MAGNVELRSLADTVTIAPDVEMHRLGLGTYKADDGPDVAREVSAGLGMGYRLIDTAALYGNEATIGETLRASGVPREDVFLTTKLWNSDQGYASTLAAFDLSLRRLGVEQLDLYLVHWPWSQHVHDTWRAMEELLASGRTRAIGVCNYLPHHLHELASFANVLPAVNQFEFHPRLQQPDLQAVCCEYGITMQAWAPLMRGHVNDIPLLVAIAEKYGKTPAQVSLRWILESDITTIPKSVQENRIAENCDVYDFSLTEEEHEAISGLDSEYRIGPNPETYAALGGTPGGTAPR
jgi:methylglyoxal/glyoxal reductase